MSEPVYHARAKCRWCGGRFVQFFHHWICETPACADRQIKRSIPLKDPPTSDKLSPYFYVPLPLQIDIDTSPTKFLLIHGKAGISKSFGSRMAAYYESIHIDGLQTLLLRVTLKQLNLNHTRYCKRELALIGQGKFIPAKDTYPDRVVMDNGAEIWMGYCDSESDIGQHTGIEWDRVRLDEASLFLPKAIREIVSRARGNALSLQARKTLGLTGGQARLLTNVGGRAQQYLEETYIAKNPDAEEVGDYHPEFYGAITGDFTDNPYLADDFETANLGGLDLDRYGQLAKNDWRIVAGQFFSQFDPTRHVGQP